MGKNLVGRVAHFYDKISVAVIDLSADLKVGDKISIEKGDESFEQTVDSMQIEHEPVQEAKAGQSIGLKVVQPTREGAEVFKVTE